MKKRFGDDNPINDSNVQDIDDTSNQSSPDVRNTMYDIHTVSGDDTRFGLLDVTHDSSNNILNNEYAVVVKNNQSVNQVVEHNCDMNGGNSNDLVENEYNGVYHVRPQSGNISSNSRNNEYAVVVKKSQSSNQEVEQNCSTNGENSDDMLESEYDKLNHVRPRSGKGSNNLYDSALGFRDDYDATYNTTDYRRADKGDDSVYDHN
ncbi:GATA zinc finger domain-containing protein 24-like [Mytilus trossulus]|uniref:GATA zinc finger domain-containing protein 24-like n=1 Tax=Mytilus trossulus TaxID=6551 RepID=UPI003007ED8F